MRLCVKLDKMQNIWNFIFCIRLCQNLRNARKYTKCSCGSLIFKIKCARNRISVREQGSLGKGGLWRVLFFQIFRKFLFWHCAVCFLPAVRRKKRQKKTSVSRKKTPFPVHRRKLFRSFRPPMLPKPKHFLSYRIDSLHTAAACHLAAGRKNEAQPPLFIMMVLTVFSSEEYPQDGMP